MAPSMTSDLSCLPRTAHSLAGRSHIRHFREDLLKMSLKAGLPVIEIEKLKEQIESVTGIPDLVEFDYDHPVALVEYRDGSIIDTVYRVK